MGIAKYEVRIGVAIEIGCALDDALEAAQAEVKFFEGGGSALVQAERQVQALNEHVDKDLDGEGDGLITSLEISKAVKRYVARAVAIIQTATHAAEQRRLMAQGKVLAYKAAVGSVKKRVDQEKELLQQVRARAVEMARAPAQEAGTGKEAHQNSAHPGATIKVQRQAEELAAEALTNAKPAPKKRSTKRSPKKKPPPDANP